jgi:hypothetical protein
LVLPHNYVMFGAVGFYSTSGATAPLERREVPSSFALLLRFKLLHTCDPTPLLSDHRLSPIDTVNFVQTLKASSFKSTAAGHKAEICWCGATLTLTLP